MHVAQAVHRCSKRLEKYGLTTAIVAAVVAILPPISPELRDLAVFFIIGGVVAAAVGFVDDAMMNRRTTA
jgi:hypothetical protein